MQRSLQAINLKTLRRVRTLSTLSALEQIAIPFKVEALPLQTTPRVPKKSVLGSGITVISKGQTSPVSSIKFIIAAGSIYESEASKGSAHFLSQIPLIGAGSKSGLRITRELENLGVDFHATADRENISFTVNVLSDKVEQAFAVVADAIINPPKALYLISEASDKVKYSYDALDSSPTQRLDELIHEAAYGDSSPLGAPFFADSLSSVSVEEVAEFRSQQYKAGNVTVSGNGLPHESLVSLTELYFQKLPTGRTDANSSAYVGGDLKVKAALGGVSYAGVAFPISTYDDSLVIYTALSDHLKDLKVPSGSLTPFFSPYSGGGLIGFLAGGSTADVTAYLKLGVEQLKAIATGGAVVNAAIKKASLNAASANDSWGEASESAVVTSTEQSVKATATSLLSATPTYVVYGKTAGTPSYSTVLSWLK